MVILAASFQLSRVADDWHYVVPAEPGELLYVASFDSGTDDWTLYESNTRNTAQVTDGVMRLQVNAEDVLFWSEASPHFGDFDATVEARPVENANSNVYGMLFRVQDASNFYGFFISADGYYTVIRSSDGFKRALSGWHRSPAINPGLGTVNILRVIGDGARFQFFINGTQVELCIPDDPANESTPQESGECLGGSWQTVLTDDSFTFGQLAVVAQANPAVETGSEVDERVIVEFDNVIVYGPE